MKEFSAEMNLDMDFLNNLNSEVQGIIGSLASNENFLDLQQPLPDMNFSDTTRTNSRSEQSPLFYDPHNQFFEPIAGPCRKNTAGREILESDDKSIKKNYRLSGKKRKRSDERLLEKPKEVVHVRAKRGQATDSHSLAERLRREKINEKLRSLQDLVPGCYKTVGMAVMLDVIINYVRSLQNQIEFLSMKLSAASLYYDFNSETDPTDIPQVEDCTLLKQLAQYTFPGQITKGTNGYDAQGMELGEGYGGGCSYFPSTWPL